MASYAIISVAVHLAQAESQMWIDENHALLIDKRWYNDEQRHYSHAKG